MATPRQGFARRDTDGQSLGVRPEIGPSSGEEYELKDIMKGPNVDVRGHGEVEYTDDVEVAPIETAGELVTQVLHVEDDPTMSAVTFRTVFLGTSKSQVEPLHGFQTRRTTYLTLE